jgi:hypothetical protein
VLASHPVRLRRLIWLPVLAALFAACSSRKQPAALVEEPDEQALDAGDSGPDGPSDAPSGVEISAKPVPDAACGYEAIDAQQDPANLYFVIDRSGSMSEKPPGSAVTKYAAVTHAVISLVKNIGWRSRVGLTLFPGAQTGNGCGSGTEALPLQPGDPKSFLDNGETGPVAAAMQKLFQVPPKGGTPTGATLAALVPQASTFGKNAYVILATDGAPNCNVGASCDAAHCIVNIEEDNNCPAGTNCCDPAVDPQFTPGNCIDRDATLQAVLALAGAGVKTIVIGIPGSEKGPYAELLSLLAVAGGVPRQGDVRYYQASDVDEIEGLLASIGSQILISCDITFAQEPPMPEQVNIYFNDDLVVYDEESGWTWTGPKSIAVHGAACETLLSGSVGQVQVVVGCPTMKPK